MKTFSICSRRCLALTLLFPIFSAFAETEAYLGVGTRPLDADQAEALEIPKGMGLLITHIPPGAPAESLLDLDDILYKLDDQLLIHPEQLAVLIRARQPGDEVALQFFRENEAHSGTLKLGEHPTGFQEVDPPQRSRTQTTQMDSGAIRFEIGGGRGGGRIAAEEQILQLIAGAEPNHGHIRIQQQGGMNQRVVTVVENNVRVAFRDQNGNQTVRANQGDEVLFDGAVNTVEERKALPGPVRDILLKRELIPADED
ncbi:MAG: PDZ domain-containing protein [Verrucomicrobia bacterium]|nr:PDZ domain-containing protein [Verrucomicrobiota bacterium]MCH8513275.1 PDZ domain-containing protein [Kiritimatiellia bacterium]